jgi:hypothetical protein
MTSVESSLLTAVEAFDVDAAEALVEGGADPDRPLPDGSTPLSRAVASGSPAMVRVLLGDGARLRLPAAERERLLALARHWYETGAEAEVRRLTGTGEAARIVRVEDSRFGATDRITLGGVTVRGAHGAILTMLEWDFRILTPPAELIDRAARTDPDHVDWWESLWTLGERRSEQTWQAVIAHRHHPSPGHRLFVADHLRCLGITTALGAERRREADRLLASWVAEESEPEVLATVLEAQAEGDDPELPSALPHTSHADPRVRRAAASCVIKWAGAPAPEALAAVVALAQDSDAGVRAETATAAGYAGRLTPGARRVLLALREDPDGAVRTAAARALRLSRDSHPSVVEALWQLLDEEEQDLRLEGAFGLSLLDDPRTPEAYDRVGPLGPDFLEDERSDGLWRWRHRRKCATGTDGPDDEDHGGGPDVEDHGGDGDGPGRGPAS